MNWLPARSTSGGQRLVASSPSECLLLLKVLIRPVYLKRRFVPHSAVSLTLVKKALAVSYRQRVKVRDQDARSAAGKLGKCLTFGAAIAPRRSATPSLSHRTVATP